MKAVRCESAGRRHLLYAVNVRTACAHLKRGAGAHGIGKAQGELNLFVGEVIQMAAVLHDAVKNTGKETISGAGCVDRLNVKRGFRKETAAIERTASVLIHRNQNQRNVIAPIQREGGLLWFTFSGDKGCFFCGNF